MKPITILELSKKLNQLVKQGYGAYSAQVSDDDEMNGTHMLWGDIYEGENVTYLNQHTNKMENNKSIVLA